MRGTDQAPGAGRQGPGRTATVIRPVYRYTAVSASNFIVEGDVNGDSIADFTLSLTTTPAAPPVATDFIL